MILSNFELSCLKDQINVLEPYLRLLLSLLLPGRLGVQGLESDVFVQPIYLIS